MGVQREGFGKGEKAAKIGFIAVLMMGVSKAVVGLISGSVSLTAQAVDSLTDLFALVAVFIGMRLSSKQPSERFPYGYYKIETIVSVVIAALILVTGFEILYESAKRALNHEIVSDPILAIGVALISMPILYLLSNYTRNVGDELNSQALKSQAGDFKADIYSSSLVLVGVVSSLLGYPRIEGVVGVIISLLVLKMGLTFGWESLLILMDAVVDPEMLELLRDTVKEVEGVRDAYNTRIRRAGPLCFGEITVSVDERIPVDQVHRLTHEIEERAKKECPMLESLVIHIEPGKLSEHVIALPISEDHGINSPVTIHFGEAPYYLLVELKDEEIEGWKTIPNPALGMDRKRGISISNKLIEEDVTTLITGELGEGPYHILRDSFIEIYKIKNEKSAKKTLRDFIKDELEPLEEYKESVGKKEDTKNEP